ncbi:flagellar assembly protein FliW [Streptomyces sp. AC495_CC817]|uniref:flagellar assembly protein FliW n=1 Tax=Streptomyces sp. AC495_CC817 TaxID=2823900 RepID=UPI001C26F960|nr:flagellar assembly protein FliW [Streptomyces sp. AC495_CC817]
MTAPVLGTPALAVEFAAPMPGLSPHTSFSLEPIAGADGLYALRAADADLRLFLLDADGDDGYAPSIPAAVRADIGAEHDDDLRILVVANPGDDGVYVNLRAPIVVHRGTGRATQAILEDQAYPVRALLGS